MELLVEQTYRFPDKPPKNVAGLIDRASLLAFYRVHNPGLATEAKVEEILSGYRGRTHVLALMLAKKYGKKLVERLQSTPRSTARRGHLGAAALSTRQCGSRGRKRRSAPPLLRRKGVPFATSPDEERAAVASARLEASYAAERLHRERTRRAEEAVEGTCARRSTRKQPRPNERRAAQLEKDLATARACVTRDSSVGSGSEPGRGGVRSGTADAEAAEARAEAARNQLGESVQAVPLARAEKAENAAKAASESAPPRRRGAGEGRA